VYKGHVQYFEFGNKVADFREGQFLGEQLSESERLNSNTIIAREETILLKFKKDEFYELLSDQVKLADKILEYI
jgi:signal-transduction protein with cAMP-binding, CBS, and nucleotidyltransferase domain